MPNKRKQFDCRFPPVRIKKIMQTDEEIGKVSATVPVIMSRAVELFLESMLVKTAQITEERKAKTLSSSHIKHVVNSDSKLGFLNQLVEKIPDLQISSEENSDAEDTRANKRGTTCKETVASPRPRGRPKKCPLPQTSKSSSAESNNSAQPSQQSRPLDLSTAPRGFLRHPGLPSPERKALEVSDRLRAAELSNPHSSRTLQMADAPPEVPLLATSGRGRKRKHVDSSPTVNKSGFNS